VLFKLDNDGTALEINVDDLGEVSGMRSWTHRRFRQMCILSGCDYLDSPQGIGLKKAFMALRYKYAEEILKEWRRWGTVIKAPKLVKGYEEKFKQAELTFLHQRVYDIETASLVPLTPLTHDLAEDDSLTEFLGPFLPPDIAKGIAIGEIDPITKRSFDLPDEESEDEEEDDLVLVAETPRPPSRSKLPEDDGRYGKENRPATIASKPPSSKTWAIFAKRPAPATKSNPTPIRSDPLPPHIFQSSAGRILNLSRSTSSAASLFAPAKSTPAASPFFKAPAPADDTEYEAAEEDRQDDDNEIDEKADQSDDDKVDFIPASAPLPAPPLRPASLFRSRSFDLKPTAQRGETTTLMSLKRAALDVERRYAGVTFGGMGAAPAAKRRRASWTDGDDGPGPGGEGQRRDEDCAQPAGREEAEPRDRGLGAPGTAPSRALPLAPLSPEQASLSPRRTHLPQEGQENAAQSQVVRETPEGKPAPTNQEDAGSLPASRTSSSRAHTVKPPCAVDTSHIFRKGPVARGIGAKFSASLGLLDLKAKFSYTGPASIPHTSALFGKVRA
ncbi:hypothetical protein BDK51DRAFT_33559, partial [Blyttiomyces helicus]